MSTPGQAAEDAAVPASPTDWGGVALNFISRAMVVLFGFAILVLVARQGPQVQGAFSLFVAIEAALVSLGSGLGLLLAREAAQTHGALPAGRLRGVLGAAVLMGTLAALLLAAASRLTVDEPYRALWMLALAAPCLLLAPTTSGLWMGQGRLMALNVTQMAAPALVVAFLVSTPFFGIAGVLGALAAWALAKSAVGLGAVAWAIARPSLAQRPCAPATTAPSAARRFVMLVALANIVSLANYRAMLFLVERIEGLGAAGVYSVAVQMAELLWLLSWAITVSVYSNIGTRDAAAAAATTLRAVRLGLAATFVAAPLLGVAAWLALPMVFGEAYRASLTPLLLLLPGVTAYAAASGLSAYYTQHRGHPHWAAGIAGLSLALTVATALWTVPRWGVAGAALATSAAYIVAIGVAFGLFKRDAGLCWSALWRGNHTRLAT
jgi:O-antigen/teichoic acid export membrane protein